MFWWKFHIYFIGYLHDGYKVKPLHIMPSKVSPYVKSYDEQTKWMYFGIKGDELLDKYNTIWDKVSADKKKKRIWWQVCYDYKFLKTKMKSYGD